MEAREAETAVIRLHDLAHSRSQRIAWYLDELGLDYDVVHYDRDPNTQRAPAELRAVHPLGKAPVLEDGELLLAESGAIVQYLTERYGAGRFSPALDAPNYPQYLYWLHFAEGSGMFPLLLDLFLGMAGEGAAPLQAAVKQELAAYLDHMATALEKQDWIAGDAFTAADILNVFVVEMAETRGVLGDRPALASYLERARQRPKYPKA